MKKIVNLLMPMAGRGSRFSKSGYSLPKPLVKLNGKPFFWWSIMSISRSVEITTLTCVILKEHIEKFDIDKKILSYFPEARFVILEDVTSGALETAISGLKCINNDLPVIINDCDHAFEVNKLSESINLLKESENLDGYLCHFKSDSPAYSYGQYDQSEKLIETVEKRVISNLAIAGAYIFKSKQLVSLYYEEYKNNCLYDELFISGLYNFMVSDGKVIKGILLDSHLSFGTPDELAFASKNNTYTNWKLQ
ncbi:nucleotidyltransferase-like protein [Vibrio diazotrophicus]|uniref:Nucleotidyltransferase-like protein n=1 Tax=Vibrio diazotrophicus TaxID=685 RepID=A0A329DY81_VIBDI|nr:nucleotidyltransferase-like protein [Vibrio diazotrophicus]